MAVATLEDAVSMAAKKIEDGRSKDQATYRDAVNRLARDEKLSGKEMDEVSAVMIRLGITPERFRSDATVLKELATLQATDWIALSQEATANATALNARIKEAETALAELKRQHADSRALNPLYAANRNRIREIQLQHADIIQDADV